MYDKILVKSGELGNRAAMPTLDYDEEQGAELGYREDEEALYIGTKSGNKRLCGAKDIGNINTSINAINSQISSINAQIRDISSQIDNIIARLETTE